MLAQPAGAAPNGLALSFAEFDRDGSGSLSPDEVVGILMRPGGGMPMTMEDALEFVSLFDSDGDGRLQWAEASARVWNV